MLKIKIRGSVKPEIDKLAIQRSVARKLVNDLKAATPVDTGEARDGWHIKEDTGRIRIVNDVEHISVLNEGHSAQAGSRFIEATVLSRPEVKANGEIVQKSPP